VHFPAPRDHRDSALDLSEFRETDAMQQLKLFEPFEEDVPADTLSPRGTSGAQTGMAIPGVEG